MKKLLFVLLFTAFSAQAQTWPAKPIRLMVPFPPGGSTDIVARIVAQKLSERLGQPIVIENRGGAGGTLGTAIVAKAAPDGYTLGVASTSTHVVAPGVYAKLDYDPVQDFAAITEIASIPLALVVHPSVPAKSVKELVCGRMAFRGQTRAHSPQSMQRSSRISALPCRTRMACVGQARMQAMRPAHCSGAMRTE